MPGGTIPPHDGHGPLHIAFAIEAGELPAWEARLDERGVAIEGRTDWSRGGHSIYFRDPDGHLLELATPGLWAVYAGARMNRAKRCHCFIGNIRKLLAGKAKLGSSQPGIRRYLGVSECRCRALNPARGER